MCVFHSCLHVSAKCLPLPELVYHPKPWLVLCKFLQQATLFSFSEAIYKFQRYTLSAPPGSPEMFAAVAGKREVVFSWSTPVTQHNGVLTSYILTCSPSPSSLPQILLSGPLTVTGFSPHTSYFCSLVAINTQGSGQPALTSFTTLQDCEPIKDHPFHNDVRLFPL